MKRAILSVMSFASMVSLAGCGTGASVIGPEATVQAQATSQAEVQADIARIVATNEAKALTAVSTTPEPDSRLVVANTDGEGVFLRRTPSAADKVKAWPEKTIMVRIGPVQEGEGRRWVNVRDPDGNEGWVPEEYLALAAGPVVTSHPASAIPGLNAADIKLNLQSRGFKCTGPTAGKSMVTWDCTSSQAQGLVEFQVSFMGADPAQIRMVDAMAFQFSQQPSDQAIVPFLGYVATLPYDGADPPRARRWVEESIGKADAGKVLETTIGGARFRLYGPIRGRILEIAPAGEQ